LFEADEAPGGASNAAPKYSLKVLDALPALGPIRSLIASPPPPRLAGEALGALPGQTLEREAVGCHMVPMHNFCRHCCKASQCGFNAIGQLACELTCSCFASSSTCRACRTSCWLRLKPRNTLQHLRPGPELCWWMVLLPMPQAWRNAVLINRALMKLSGKQFSTDCNADCRLQAAAVGSSQHGARALKSQPSLQRLISCEHLVCAQCADWAPKVAAVGGVRRNTLAVNCILYAKKT